MHKSLNTKNVSSTKFYFGLLMLSTGNELYMTHLGKSKQNLLRMHSYYKVLPTINHRKNIHLESSVDKWTSFVGKCLLFTKQVNLSSNCIQT